MRQITQHQQTRENTMMKRYRVTFTVMVPEHCDASEVLAGAEQTHDALESNLDSLAGTFPEGCLVVTRQTAVEEA